VKTGRTRDGSLTAIFFSEMTGKKKNTVNRRKRKGKPSLEFKYTRRKRRKRPLIDGEIPEAISGV